MENVEKRGVTYDTRISTLISMKGTMVIEALVLLNPHFKKLRNPVLRRLFAARVSIRDACRIANCPLSDFMNTLKNLGFSLAIDTDLVNNINKGEEIFNSDLFFEEFDVRSILSRGEDPLKAILNKVELLPKETGLKLINSFEPLPLIRLMYKKGYSHRTETKGPEEFITFFFKNSSVVFKKQSDLPAPIADKLTFADLLIRYKNRIKEIDVRKMEMPQPMVSILNTLDQLPSDWALYVHHKKLPLYLIPHLEDKGFSFVYNEVDDENLLLIIYPAIG